MSKSKIELAPLAPTEQTELSTEKEELSPSFVALALIHTSISLGITYYHLVHVPQLMDAIRQKVIDPESFRWLIDFAQYLGDNENGFFACMGVVVLDAILTLTERMASKYDHLRKAIGRTREAMPYILVPLIILAILDVETLQLHSGPLLDLLVQFGLSRKMLYPWVQGTPVIGDIYAGLYGIIAGAGVYELYKAYVRKALVGGLAATHIKPASLEE